MDHKGNIVMMGDRYETSGHKMPYFRPWFEETLGVDLDFMKPSQRIGDIGIPPPIENDQIYDELLCADISFSNAPLIRLMRGHGHTLHEIFYLRHGKFPRLPDIVVWPRSEEDVMKEERPDTRRDYQLAMEKNCAIIPIGGGTSVSSALECPAAERRAVISLDMALMDKIIWIDKENLTCRAQ
ncbi:hypothetical protein OSTOST_17749, partial [Ostertagia ostertagi]